MTHVRDEVCDLGQPRFMLGDQSAQLLLRQIGLVRLWLVCAHKHIVRLMYRIEQGEFCAPSIDPLLHELRTSVLSSVSHLSI